MKVSALQMNPYDKINKTSLKINNKQAPVIDKIEDNINNSAVNLSISVQSIKAYLNIKSSEISQNNSNAQTALNNIINNPKIYDFLSDKQSETNFTLSSIGYKGKPITELTQNEAKALISENGFFGIEKTSQRVSSFAISIAQDDLEALKESRKGIVQGFEEAQKLWGSKLPDISYKTQEKTLALIDKKIEELSDSETTQA